MSGRRFLIMRTDRIGDVVLSTPVVRSLRAAYPDAYIAMMVRPGNRELVEGNPDLNEVILFDKKGKHGGWLYTLRFAAELKKKKFDTALILHTTSRVILLAWLAGIPRRIGYRRYGHKNLSRLLTDALPDMKREGERHELDYSLDLLKPLGVQAIDRTMYVPTNAAQESKVEEFLRANNINGAPLIAVHPGASCLSKRWPPERFAEVADRLAERHGAAIVVVTSRDEAAAGTIVMNSMKRKAVPALGQFTLGELACLFRKSKCLVSNDSGPVHVAGAVGTPVVSIFGRWEGGLSPVRWGPTGAGSVAIHHDVGCRPCLAHACTVGFRCLESVSIDEVFAAVEQAAGLRR